MRQVQIKMTNDDEWHVFDNDLKNPHEVVEKLKKNWKCDAKVVEMAEISLPQEVMDSLTKMPDYCIVQVNQSGIKVKTNNKITIVQWNGEVINES